MTTDKTTEQQTNQSNSNVAQTSRRKFLTQAGVGALPVLLTMKSGDAWGCVGLECTYGDTNLSGTKSAVMSVQTQQGSGNYVIPVWSSISLIKDVVKKDFGRNIGGYAGYLLSHYDFGYKKVVVKKGKVSTTTYELLSGTVQTEAQWYQAAKNLGEEFYIRASATSSTYNKFKDSRGLIRPVVYNDKIITGQTNMGTFFPKMGSITLWTALNSGNDFQKYVSAAFVGSIWQQHSIWTQAYSQNIKHNPYCYPKTEEILKAYNTVVEINSKTHPRGVEGALSDMGILFKMYTKS